MGFLVAGIAALVVGPILYRLIAGSRLRMARVILDVLIVCAIAGIVLWHILPHAFHNAGWSAGIFLVLGLLGPTVLEVGLRKLSSAAHTGVRLLVVVGVLIHALLDGLALSMPETHSGEAARSLALAVALHRLPDGLVLWWLVTPRYGSRVAIAVLVFVAIATVIGFMTGGAIGEAIESRELAWFEAFVAGTLLHVAVHRHDAHH